MSNKEKMLAVIQSLPEGATIDEAIDKLYLLWKIERGIEQAEAGEVTEHDDFMREILGAFHGARLLREEDLGPSS